MSDASPLLNRRERALQAARRRLQRLEIETHRIKAELARLEAGNEEDIADELALQYRRDRARRLGGSSARDPSHVVDGASRPLLPASPERLAVLGRDSPTGARRLDRTRRRRQQPALPVPKVNVCGDGSKQGPAVARRRKRLPAPALMLSLAFHASLLALCGLATITTLASERVPLLATSSTVEHDLPAEISEIEIEPTEWEEQSTFDLPLDRPADSFGANVPGELTPVANPWPVPTAGEPGLADLLEGDVGTLTAGQGGGAPGGGPLGSTSFFGTRSRGDRFVFLIDNSSSMKDGRLEASIEELLESVEAMTRRQAFYVIFVSDQPYPMFYPEPAAGMLPATEPNKALLREWVKRVQSRGGKNRQLIPAMELAASLRPHAVFFLWDGDLPYETVRDDVMEYFTGPHEWDFLIHTLGMGVKNQAHEQHLQAIAEAHGGTYRRVRITSGRSR